jgi:hypothetical protein
MPSLELIAAVGDILVLPSAIAVVKSVLAGPFRLPDWWLSSAQSGWMQSIGLVFFGSFHSAEWDFGDREHQPKMLK